MMDTQQQQQRYEQSRLHRGIILFIFLVLNSSSNYDGNDSFSAVEAFVFSTIDSNNNCRNRRRRCRQQVCSTDFGVLRKHPQSMASVASSSSSSPSVSIPSSTSRSCHQSISRHHQSSSRLYATVAQSSSSTFNSLNEFNIHLEKLAAKCGSVNEPVISLAAECQELWQSETSRHLDEKDAGNAAIAAAASVDNNSGHFEPDIVSFRNMLTAWSRCTKTLAQSRRSADYSISSEQRPTTDSGAVVDVYTPLDAAKRATSLLLAYPKTDLDSYNIVVDAWSKSRAAEAPEAAGRLMRRLLDNDSDVGPNSHTYNLLIDSWANSKKENSLDKVMQIYGHMRSLDQQGKGINPNIRTINAVLNAHAKKVAQYTSQSTKEGFDQARGCADAAYDILQDAKKRYQESGDVDDMPDVATYTSVMDGYSRCGTYGACQKAESLLSELKELYATTKNFRYKLNFRTYTAVVSAWSRTRCEESPGRVEALLREMAQDPATKPNSRTYTAAIQCWARSRDPLKAKRVLKILMDMREEFKATGNEDVRPSILTYNNAIDTCARCQGSTEQQTEAMKIAFAILKTIEMDDASNPNETTYSTLIRGLSFLMPSGKERDNLASMVFEKAKKAGLVDFACVKNLHRTIDREALRIQLDGRLDRNGTFKYQDLPPAWSRNVA
jgi:hypothetical protein